MRPLVHSKNLDVYLLNLSFFTKEVINKLNEGWVSIVPKLCRTLVVINY